MNIYSANHPTGHNCELAQLRGVSGVDWTEPRISWQAPGPVGLGVLAGPQAGGFTSEPPDLSASGGLLQACSHGSWAGLQEKQ